MVEPPLIEDVFVWCTRFLIIAIFNDDATQYGIHCILKAVNDIRYIKNHDPATRARSGWTLEILKVIFDVPTLGLVRLPEFEDASCISFSPMVYQRLPTATLCMPGCPPRHVCVAERRSLLLTYYLPATDNNGQASL